MGKTSAVVNADHSRCRDSTSATCWNSSATTRFRAVNGTPSSHLKPTAVFLSYKQVGKLASLCHSPNVTAPMTRWATLRLMLRNWRRTAKQLDTVGIKCVCINGSEQGECLNLWQIGRIERYPSPSSSSRLESGAVDEPTHTAEPRFSTCWVAAGQYPTSPTPTDATL